MLELNSKDIRFLARMGARGVLGQFVYDYLNDGKKLYVVSADLAHASGFDRIKKKYPEKLINVGIAEQDLIGVSAGMAQSDVPVVATSWAMFTTTRVADQVRNYMGFMQKNVKLIGMDSGFVQAKFSYSHSNPPDIAIMRAIPGIKILSPCDGMEIYKLLYEALENEGPVYIRLTGDSLLPILHKERVKISIGKSIKLREGKDAAIIATGNIVRNAFEAAIILNRCGIDATVIDMHTIEPLDKACLDELLGFPIIITVEEHLLHGGLGSAISEYYACQREKPRQIMLGIDNKYPLSGDVRFVEECNGLTAEAIADRILREVRSFENSKC